MRKTEGGADCTNEAGRIISPQNVDLNVRARLQHNMASARQEKQREREAGLVSAVASLEKEKETLSRGMEMAQERCAERTRSSNTRVLHVVLPGHTDLVLLPKIPWWWWCSGQVEQGLSRFHGEVKPLHLFLCRSNV